jgi:hypothetical protein
MTAHASVTGCAWPLEAWLGAGAFGQVTAHFPRVFLCAYVCQSQENQGPTEPHRSPAAHPGAAR